MRPNRGIGMTVVRPEHQIRFLAQPRQRSFVPIVHHVVPQDRADRAGNELVQQWLHKLEVERGLAVLLDKGASVGVCAERPVLVAAQVKMRDWSAAAKDIVDHRFDQLASAGGERVDRITSVGNLAQGAAICEPQRRFHVAERLNKRDHLQSQLARSAMKVVDLLGRIRRRTAETRIDLPRKRVLPFDQDAVEFRGGKEIKQF
jgi:hypothetical protein